MDVNAPRRGYADPASLHPGDTIELVVPPPSQSSLPPPSVDGVPQMTVEAGDSYWRIATEHLGADASDREVLDLTNDLIDLNNPILAAGDPTGARNYDTDRAMIHPGDTVYLADPAPQPPPRLHRLPSRHRCRHRTRRCPARISCVSPPRQPGSTPWWTR